MNNREETVKTRGVRRHNSSGKHGTINQNVQRSNPKFRAQGNGILVHVKSGSMIARGKDNRWMSVPNSGLVKQAESTPPLSPPQPDVIIVEDL